MFKWICPVCGSKCKGETVEFDVCKTCGWEDDHLQRDNPDYEGGANSMSLNQAKEAYANDKPIK